MLVRIANREDPDKQTRKTLIRLLLACGGGGVVFGPCFVM